MSFISNYLSKSINNDEVAFERTMKVLTGIMMVAGGVIASLHYFVRQISNEEAAKEEENANKAFAASSGVSKQGSNSKGNSAPAAQAKSKHPKMSLTESIRVLASSKYLINVATMVLSYGLTIEFTEIIWKAAVKAAFPVKTDYLKFMGRYSTLVGSAAFVMMFVGAKVVKSLGWKAGALLTPILMGFFTAPFFACLIWKGTSSHTALLAAVYIGLFANVLSKATKYAVFDPTKEMAYIPLDHNSKTKGKAAIDVLGARLGKSGGAFVQQILVLSLGSIFNGAGVVAACFYVVIGAWISKFHCFFEVPFVSLKI